jgi:hypothetical protein
MTGKMPEMISYPNGDSSPEIQQIAQEIGLPLGVLVRGGKNRLPLKIGARAAMTLKRFILWGDRGIDAQCRASRADLSLSRLLSGFAAKTTAGWPKGGLRERFGENRLAIQSGEKKVKQSGSTGTND